VIEQEPTAEQRRLGLRCRAHTEIIFGMLAHKDIDGAMAYLNDVEQKDGGQMVANVTDLMVLMKPGILPPDMV
jgi:hypothetical protein